MAPENLIKMQAEMVKNGEWTIDRVPSKIRAQVQKLLKQENEEI